MKSIYAVLFLLLAQASHAQTIITVGNEKVSVQEFKRVYNKNSNLYKDQLYTKANLESYTELYELYLMKLQEANALKLDTQAKIRQEIQTYTDQLAAKYTNDNEALDAMADQAYKRMQFEWNISHILVRIPMASLADSSAALQKIKEIQTSIKNGSLTFEDAAKMYSDDNMSKNNRGSIGWVTVFQTPYAFENGFANLSEGQMSDIVATAYGYHIIKVNKKRGNFGQLKVAQILVQSLASATPEEDKKAQIKAGELYVKASGGEDFAKLAEDNSDDKYSKNKGGELDWITPGKTIEKFEDAIFGLSIGQVSKPVRTEFGYHIVKMLDKKPLGTESQEMPSIKSSVGKDERGSIARNEYLQSLKNRYKVIEKPELMTRIANSLDTADYANGVLNTSLDPKELKSILVVNGTPYSFNQFSEFVSSYSRNRFFQNKEVFINNMYSAFESKVINDVRLNELLTTNPEYKNLVDDYKNGILIFDLMENKVWMKASTDTVGQMAYYNSHKSDYMWKQSAEYDLFTSADKKDLEAIINILGKQTNLPEEAIAKLRANNPESRATFSHKVQELNSLPPAVQQAFGQNQPTGIIEENGKYEMYIPVLIQNQPTVKTFQEAKGYVLSDYQNYLEKSWIESLRAKYPVVINQPVWNSLIKK